MWQLLETEHSGSGHLPLSERAWWGALKFEIHRFLNGSLSAFDKRARSDSGHQWVTQNMSGSLNSENAMFGIVIQWNCLKFGLILPNMRWIASTVPQLLCTNLKHNRSCQLIFSKEGSKITTKQKPTKLEQCMLSRLCSHCHIQLKVVESAFDFLSILCSGPFTLLRQTPQIAWLQTTDPLLKVLYIGDSKFRILTVSVSTEKLGFCKKKSQEKKHACPFVSLLWGH